MSEPILPGASLGVLGGGQLGRMFALAANRLGYRVHVFDPTPGSPAGQVSHEAFVADYDDMDAVARFAQGVEVVTFEFENVPSETAAAAARHAPVRPAGSLLHTAQNRAREKQGLTALGLPVAPFAIIESEDDLAAAADVGFPAVLKTASAGYDGKGQRKVEDASDLADAWHALGGVPTVLERFLQFEAELSVVAARGVDGEVATYEPTWNQHENHILDVSVCPAPQPDAVLSAARDLGRQVVEGLDVVGVLCVELFWLGGDQLVVNELAPRPHNSGHLTIDAHECSQFEQQVRAVCGLPLGSTERTVPAAAMANLLGDLWERGTPRWVRALEQPGHRLHLYGKEQARPGRKMGHLTVLGDSAAEVERLARGTRASLVPEEELTSTGA